jgi:hypothetical protein
MYPSDLQQYRAMLGHHAQRLQSSSGQEHGMRAACGKNSSKSKARNNYQTL